MKRFVIAGGSGFLGGCLTRFLEEQGHTVNILTRHAPRNSRDVQWDGKKRGIWEHCLSGADVLINLCGKSVNCRYHARNREELVRSRLEPTRLLGEALRDMATPPPVWIQASTATLYQHTFAEPWREDGVIAPHPDAKDAFSIELAQAWEECFLAALPDGVRPVLLRSSMVLGDGQDSNDVLRMLRKLTRLGLGGPMAGGHQYVSWIHRDDFCRALLWVIQDPTLHGVINFCSPHPLPNRDMMRILREHFRRPVGLPAPALLLEFGAFFLRTETELILKSRRVYPGRLLDSGFLFHFPHFEQALQNLFPS